MLTIATEYAVRAALAWIERGDLAAARRSLAHLADAYRAVSR